jgi:hypothetical protein
VVTSICRCHSSLVLDSRCDPGAPNHRQFDGPAGSSAPQGKYLPQDHGGSGRFASAAGSGIPACCRCLDNLYHFGVATLIRDANPTGARLTGTSRGAGLHKHRRCKLLGLANTMLPEAAFPCLHTLLINCMLVQCASDILRVEGLIDNVTALRIEIAPVHDLEVAEDVVYMQIFHNLATAPHLRNLCFVAGHAQHVPGYILAPETISPLIANWLDILCLYHGSSNELGFSVFYAPGQNTWEKVTQIAMMH